MFLNIFFLKKKIKSRKRKIMKNLSKIPHLIILLSFILNFSFPQFSLASSIDRDQGKNKIKRKNKTPIVVIHKNYHQIKVKKNFANKIVRIKYSKYIIVTAYSSTIDQCDSTPFITANGKRVYDGIIAANFLKFGTKVRFPEYSGNKIYIVEDRMHQRFSNRVDIWMNTRTQAINFGVKRLKMEILK